MPPWAGGEEVVAAGSEEVVLPEGVEEDVGDGDDGVEDDLGGVSLESGATDWSLLRTQLASPSLLAQE